MNNKHTIVYIMRHIDIGGNIDIPYKKVGITGAGNATLTTRLQQISNTKSPIKAQCVAAWEHHDAKAIENAMHMLLEDSRIEGEWFLDKDDSLVERMHPIMELLGAKEIKIGGEEDSYTKSILKKENESKSLSNQALLGEISKMLKDPLRTSIRDSGPTFFSDKSNLTYYVGYRKSGNHNLSIGRCQKNYNALKLLLEQNGYDVEQHERGHGIMVGLTSLVLSEIINIIESEFTAS